MDTELRLGRLPSGRADEMRIEDAVLDIDGNVRLGGPQN